jgi:flagellar protein FliO/FliZ
LSGYGSYIVETFVTLLAVCGLAFVLLYGARRFGMGRARGGIELVGQLPLEARRSIYLVKVGETVLVVGASEAGFTKLGEMPVSSLPPAEVEVRGGRGVFADVLARARKADRAAPEDVS